MKLFGKKKNGETNENIKTNGVSTKSVMYALIIFCTIATSYLLYIIINAFS